jgi:hypothetical protein
VGLQAGAARYMKSLLLWGVTQSRLVVTDVSGQLTASLKRRGTEKLFLIVDNYQCTLCNVLCHH